MKKIMKEKNHVVPDEVLSKEFLSQFKTEADVSKFLKQLHAQVTAVIPVTAATPRKSKPNTVKRSYLFPVTVTVNSIP